MTLELTNQITLHLVNRRCEYDNTSLSVSFFLRAGLVPGGVKNTEYISFWGLHACSAVQLSAGDSDDTVVYQKIPFTAMARVPSDIVS
jgi:hypothetical protein